MNFGALWFESCDLRSRCEPIFGGKKVYTKGVFSSENSSASTGKKEVWCIPKSLFSREKGGKYIYTKEPSRWLLGSPSRSIGVQILASYNMAIRIAANRERWFETSKARASGIVPVSCRKSLTSWLYVRATFAIHPAHGAQPPCQGASTSRCSGCKGSGSQSLSQWGSWCQELPSLLLATPQESFRVIFNLWPCKAKTALRGKNNLGNVNFMLV